MTLWKNAESKMELGMKNSEQCGHDYLPVGKFFLSGIFLLVFLIKNVDLFSLLRVQNVSMVPYFIVTKNLWVLQS